MHSRASTHGKDVAGHYLLKDIERQVAHSYLADAASLLSQHAADAPITAAALQLYTRLAAAILRLPEAHRSSQCESDMQSALVSVYSRTRSLVRSNSHLLRPHPTIVQRAESQLTVDRNIGQLYDCQESNLLAWIAHCIQANMD